MNQNPIEILRDLYRRAGYVIDCESFDNAARQMEAPMDDVERFVDDVDHTTYTDRPSVPVTRIGNVAEVSDLGRCIHFVKMSSGAMFAVNEHLSVHDKPELKQRALEFIRRLQEFQKMLEKGDDV